MKKFYTFLFLLFLIANPLCAATFWVTNDDPEQKEASPLVRIMQQKQVRFSIVSNDQLSYPTDALTDYTVRGLVHWFKKLKDALAEPEAKEQRAALERYKAAIAFGANKNSFVSTFQSAADIRVYFMSDAAVQKRCNYPKAVACVSPNGPDGKKIIYFGYPPVFHIEGKKRYFPVVRTLLHELGHVWGLADLYQDTYGKERKYGNGVQKSIMYFEKEDLTCDDLDGFSNMLYFAAKQNNPDEPDLIFPSFCDKTILYRNGEVYRPGIHVTENKTSREYVYLCEKPQKAFTVTVHPLDFDNLIVKKDFEACAEEMPDIVANEPFRELTAQQVQEFTNIQNISPKEKVFYKPLIKGEKSLTLFMHLRGKIPVYAYILDENKQVIFLFAHLGNGLNWAYNALFEKNKSLPVHAGKQIIMYSRNAPQKRFYWFNHESPAGMTPQETAEFSSVTFEILRQFQKDLPLAIPYANTPAWEDDTIQKLASWDNYLTNEFLQNVELEKRFKKDLEKLFKK